MRIAIRALLFILALPLLARAEENWPQWRGPNLDGRVEAANLPVQWSEGKNIVWKVPVPSWSGSTPAVWSDRIFLASPESSQPDSTLPKPESGGNRRVQRDPGGESILLLCLSRKDGAELWRREVSKGNYFRMKQNMSSPSPVTDGELVWAFAGTGQLVAFDFSGKEIWRRDLQKDYGAFGQNHGYASSPLLYEDRLIVPVLHGMRTDDPSYLLALDKKTGKEIWKTVRPTDAIDESPDSYATPQLLMQDGRALAVINGGDIVTAHDIETGKEIWRGGGANPKNSPWYRVIASCVVSGDRIFAPSRKSPLTAIKAGGSGDVTATHVLWRYDRGPDVPTPVTDGKLLWLVDDIGILTCLDAETGQPIYEPQRIAQGTYSSSPILADGKIYTINENGVTTVLEAGPQFKVLATNELDATYVLSSPVVIGDQIFIRTDSHLYCIANLTKGDS